MLKGQKIGEKSGKYINCEICTTPKYFYRYQLNSQKHFFCSTKCGHIAQKGKDTWISKHAQKGIRLNTGKTLFKKGFTPWNKGLHTGIKPWLGKKRPQETIEKIKKSRIGITTKENHPMWKGGITPFLEAERARFRKTIQKEVLKRDNYTCQLCGTRGGILHVDHIQSWDKYIELRFEMSNCRTLCQKCHYKITYGKPMTEKSIYWGNAKGGNYLRD